MDVRLRLLAVALAALAVCAPPAAAAPGDLDASFSGDGRVSTLTSPDTFVARAVAMQPDGRIVVAGYSCNTGTCGPTGDSSFRLLRYTSDGGLDTDFGQGGMVTTTVGVGRSQAFDVIVRADGSIVAGGVASADALDPGSFALVGYKANGTLDTIVRHRRPRDHARRRGLRRDLRPRAGLRRPLHRGRAGQRRRARPLRARPLRPPRQAGPELRRHGERRRADLGALRLRRGRRAAARRPRRRGRRVRQQLGDREPALQRHARSASAAARRAPWIRPVGASYSYANAVVALADGRVLSAGVATERLGNPAMALMRTSPAGVLDRTWDGDGLGARARRRRHGGQRRACSTPRAARWRPATRRSARDHAFAVARFDGAGALDRSFGGGVVLTSFPGTRAPAPPRSPGRPTASSWWRASPAAPAAAPQCTGGTARLALARYLVAAARRRGARAAARRRRVTRPKFVTLPSRLTVHRGVVRVKVRCVQAKRCKGKLSLRRLRKGRSALLLGSKTATVKARRTRTIVVKVRRKRLDRHRKSRVRMRVRGPRRDRRAPQDHQERDAEARLSHAGPASA